MNPTIRISGLPQARERIQRAGMPVRRAIVDEIKRQAFELQTRVVEKLSGLVLHVRSGTLRRSITTQIRERSTGIDATVGTNVEYAKIHEYGGTIHIPEITPVHAEALHFVVGGEEVFAMRARAHDVHMPERSYLRSSLRERRAAILLAIRHAIALALRTGR